MKQIKIFLVLIYSLLSSIVINGQINDMAEGYESFILPENIQSLLYRIKTAEDTEDWNSYYQLREQIIQAWTRVNPEVAKLYRTISDGKRDFTADGTPINSKRNDEVETFHHSFKDSRTKSDAIWGTDKLIFQGKANDISMDISRTGDIYIAVSGCYDGSAIRDTVYILKSTDEGENWIEWSKISSSTQNFKQVEIMLFDGQIGGSLSQKSYILLFYLFDNGWLRVGRSETISPSWSYYTISGSDASGAVTHFAVDRNNTPSNYRAFCMYDSISGSNTLLKVIRSEPNSYGAIWQDDHSLGYLGRDLDLCYGWNGAVYASFNGASSGNLYVRENTNFADPSSWQPIVTLVNGSTNTTRHGQIIASRDNLPDNIVALIFEKQIGASYDLYWVSRPPNVGWDTLQGWVLPDENKWPVIYSRRITGNRVFSSVFERSGINNAPPRAIRYKNFDGTSWTDSEPVSDPSIDVAGQEKPEVADIDGNTPVFAYIGGSLVNVYFDNFSWVPSDVNEGSNTPETYSLTQNYPNPFNPSTTIKYSIPEQSFVKIKVFNLLGQEIAELVNQELQTGNYEVTFDASNLSSGIYFYRMETGNYIQTRKMILMK